MKSSRMIAITSVAIMGLLFSSWSVSTVHADILLSQLDGAFGDGFGLGSNDWRDGSVFDILDTEAADDFVIGSGLSWTIEQIFFEGQSGYTDGSTPVIEAAHLRIYDDNGGLPGAIVHELLNQPVVGNAQYDFTLDTSLVLNSGSYWLSVQAADPDNSNWVWSRREPATGQSGVWRNPPDGFATGHTDWTSIPDLSFLMDSPTTSDLVFEVRGTVTAVPEPSSGLLLSAASLGLAFYRRRSNQVRS